MLKKIILITWFALLIFRLTTLSLEIPNWLKNTTVVALLAATSLYIFLCREEILGRPEKQKQQPPD